jgi:hypothetical protein
MAINGWGAEKHGSENRRVAPVTLPAVNLPNLDVAREAKETAERIAITRTIRRGLDAWRAINKAESFNGWKAIGAALAIGKAHALKVTSANTAWGRNYSREFSQWMKLHGFDRMPKPTRSVAIELHENASAIEAWRATLPERQRKRLVHPLSNVRRWRACTAHNGGKTPGELAREARAAWKRFAWCLRALPARQAAPLWQAALAEVAAITHGE